MRELMVGGLLASMAVGAIGCGGTKGKCAEGTVRHGSTCYPYDPDDTTPAAVTVDPPERTRYVGDVRLTTDEPATIYYTADGTTPTLASANEPDVVLIPDVPDDGIVKYFTVDLAGNTSEVTTARWVVDRTGPDRPGDFQLTLSGTQRTVNWNEPFDADLGGVVLARVDGRFAAPEDGTFYAAGDEIAPGVTVVRVLGVGTAGTFSESMATPPGLVRYAAWSYDDLGNYSGAAADYELIAVPAQTGAISINASSGVVTVGTQPSHLELSGTATLNGTDLDVELNVENRTTRVLFAPKLVIRNLSGTTGTWTDNDGSHPVTGDNYRQYGAAIAPGQSLTRTFLFQNVGSLDVPAFDVELLHNWVIAGAFWDNTAATIADPVVEDEVLVLGDAGPARGFDGQQSMRGGAITPDGRLVLGSRTSPYLTAFDLTTGIRTGGNPLQLQKSSIPRLIVDASGATGYALVIHGHLYQSRQGGTASYLVRFDVETLAETGRIELGIGKNRDLEISPDGSTLAIATGIGDTILVDLDSFKIRERLPGGADAVVFRSPTELITAGTAMITVWDLSQGEPAIVDSFVTPSFGGRFGSAAIADDDRLWIGRRSGVIAFDLATGNNDQYSTGAASLEVFEGKPYVCSNSSIINRLDTTNGTSDLSISTNSSIYGHWLGRSPF